MSQCCIFSSGWNNSYATLVHSLSTRLPTDFKIPFSIKGMLHIQQAAGYQVGSTDCCLCLLSLSISVSHLTFIFYFDPLYFKILYNSAIHLNLPNTMQTHLNELLCSSDMNCKAVMTGFFQSNPRKKWK